MTTQIVRAEWFWISVQNEEAQDEREYLFEDVIFVIFMQVINV